MFHKRRLLIVDDDRATCDLFSIMLQARGLSVITAGDVRNALRLALEQQPWVALVDVRLPDGSGMDILRAVARLAYSTKVIIMTGFGTCAEAVEAMRLGAYDYLEKPVDIDHIYDALNSLQSRELDSRHQGDALHSSHAIRRWAEMIIRVVESTDDPRTVRMWARCVVASTGALRNWCHMAHLSPKRSLTFARVLRAVVRKRPDELPQDLLDVIDRRTLASLLSLGDKRRSDVVFPRSIDEYLERQLWITRPLAVEEVRTLLRERFKEHTSASSVRT